MPTTRRPIPHDAAPSDPAGAGTTPGLLARRRSVLAGVGGGVLALALGAGPAAAAASGKPTIGVVVPTLSAQFWNTYVDFIRKGADQLGVNLVVLNADNKPDQMIKSLEDLVARPVDGIMPLLTTTWSVSSSLRQAARAARTDRPTDARDARPTVRAADSSVSKASTPASSRGDTSRGRRSQATSAILVTTVAPITSASQPVGTGR